MRRFWVSKPIAFNIFDYLCHRQSLSGTLHHVDAPLMLNFFSSSAHNRCNDSYGRGRSPQPRRYSCDGSGASDRIPSSSPISGFINGPDNRVNRDNSGQGRRDFDTNRKRDYCNGNRYRPSSQTEVNKADCRISEGNSSYVLFDDDEQKPHLSPNRQVKDRKFQDVDGFLERFKLGFDEERTNPSSDVPPEDADEIFRKMKETGLIPNTVAMLHGLCRDGLVQDALKLFVSMRERGTIPEVVIYTAVVEGFCKAQKLQDAKRIFRKMQSNGVVANAYSYGVLVQGLCEGKRLDDALEFCLEMVEAGHLPNMATFTVLIDGFCRERGMEAAQMMISKLREKGFCFDEKEVREYMDKKGLFFPMVWEAILGKQSSQMF